MRDSVDKVDFKNSKNQKDDKDLIIGDQAQSYIAQSEKHGLGEAKVKQFYAGVKLYFTAVTTYFVDKLPIKDPVLKHADVLDVKLQQTAKLSYLTFFLSVASVDSQRLYTGTVCSVSIHRSLKLRIR